MCDLGGSEDNQQIKLIGVAFYWSLACFVATERGKTDTNSGFSILNLEYRWLASKIKI
jgi:hypothetical protein